AEDADLDGVDWAAGDQVLADGGKFPLVVIESGGVVTPAIVRIPRSVGVYSDSNRRHRRSHSYRCLLAVRFLIRSKYVHLFDILRYWSFLVVFGLLYFISRGAASSTRLGLVGATVLG